MSADNWGKCPKCQETARRNLAVAKEDRLGAYGKVPLEEYKKLEAHVSALEKERLGDTLREDYEIGITDGEFEVSYSASCRVCGFTHKFYRTEKAYYP